jgi:hypothetical protein
MLIMAQNFQISEEVTTWIKVLREKAHYPALDPDPSINKENNYEKTSIYTVL